MATIKEAVQNAIIFAKEALEPERVSELQLEEVQSSSAGGQEAWLFTSMLSRQQFGLRAFGESKRDYKIFTVLKANGEVTSMKIRELATT